MERSADVVDIIYQDHTKTREKLAVLEDLLRVINRDDVWERIGDVMDFFNKHLVGHFRNEEILISVLRRGPGISPDQEKGINGLLGEHAVLLDFFGHLGTVAAAYDPGNERKRAQFVEIAANMIELLLSHAEREDVFLFPLARQLLSSGQLDEVSRMIAAGGVQPVFAAGRRAPEEEADPLRVPK